MSVSPWGNAPDYLKDKADYVTDTVDQTVSLRRSSIFRLI